MTGAKVLGGAGAPWLEEFTFPMFDKLKQQIALMHGEGLDPYAIVMTPREMANFLNEASRTPGNDLRHSKMTKTGWAFMGLPIWRSREVAGMAVLTEHALNVLSGGGLIF